MRRGNFYIGLVDTTELELPFLEIKRDNVNNPFQNKEIADYLSVHSLSRNDANIEAAKDHSVRDYKTSSFMTFLDSVFPQMRNNSTEPSAFPMGILASSKGNGFLGMVLDTPTNFNRKFYVGGHENLVTRFIEGCCSGKLNYNNGIGAVYDEQNYPTNGVLVLYDSSDKGLIDVGLDKISGACKHYDIINIENIVENRSQCTIGKEEVPIFEKKDIFEGYKDYLKNPQQK